MRQKLYLTSDDVLRMAAACKAEAEKNNWKVSFAIVDDAGAPFYLERMDGAAPNTAEVAIAKAKTAAHTRRSSKVWEDRVKERPGFLSFPGVMHMQGGLPVIHQGECVGGVGVSGVQSDFDEQIAQAGVDAVDQSRT
jgi:glc operon protein GlcG